MDTIMHLGIVIASLIILYYAYFMKSELAKLIVFVILGAILIGDLLGILAGISFLEFLRNAFTTIRSLIIYIEIILIVFLTFFKLKGKHSLVLRISTIVLLVLLLLVEFNLF